MTTLDLRQTILDHSYKTMTKKGVTAIRMRDIASACACAVGTIYNVFDTFDDIHFNLNLRTFKRLYERLYKALQEATQSGVSLEDALPQVGWEYIAFAKEETHCFKALFEYAPQKEQPVWYREAVSKHLGQIIELMEKHYGLTTEKADRLISYFWFSIHGVCSIVLNKKSTAHSDEFIEPYVDHCLRGIYKLV